MYVTAKNSLSNDIIYVAEVVAGLKIVKKTNNFGAYIVSSNSCFVLQNSLG